MKCDFHAAEGRGSADHGWLKAKHSFSFGEFYHPQRMGVGKLRVLNDDYIFGGQGFAPHEHQDMEIITIPLKGGVKHQDSMGNEGVVSTGEVQVMSAGSGVVHSEFNASDREELNLFQIWIETAERGHAPRYDQKRFNWQESKTLQRVASPDGAHNSLKVLQNAWIWLGSIEEKLSFSPNNTPGALYLMQIQGKSNLGNYTLGPRDALAISEPDEKLDIQPEEKSQILLIDVATK